MAFISAHRRRCLLSKRLTPNWSVCVCVWRGFTIFSTDSAWYNWVLTETWEVCNKLQPGMWLLDYDSLKFQLSTGFYSFRLKCEAANHLYLSSLGNVLRYLHVGGLASEVLWLGRPPGCSAVLSLSAASSFLLRLCWPHHHKVHTHLTGLNTKEQWKPK